MRSGARLNLQIAGMALSIAQQHWDLSQPPMQPSKCAQSCAHTYSAAGMDESQTSMQTCYAGGWMSFASRPHTLQSASSSCRA